MNKEPVPCRWAVRPRINPWIPLALAALLLAVPSVGSAGLVLEEKTELVGGPPVQGQPPGVARSRASTTYLEGKKIRTESEGHVWVMDFDKGLLITINPVAKTYTEMSLKDVKETQKQAMQWMETLRQQMEEKMKDMPPEQKEIMRKRLDSMPQGMLAEEKPAKITVKPTADKETINGFACKAYDVYEGDELATRYWLTTSVSTEVFDAYQEELKKWLEGMGPMGASRLQEWEHIRGKGFPIKVTRLKPIAGKAAFNREVLKVEEKSLSESLFQPPKDYTRTEAPALPTFGAQPGKMAPPKMPPPKMPPPE